MINVRTLSDEEYIASRYRALLYMEEAGDKWGQSRITKHG
jgi:hypothetical protein